VSTGSDIILNVIAKILDRIVVAPYFTVGTLEHFLFYDFCQLVGNPKEGISRFTKARLVLNSW
jgi:hypothetical protein